MPNSSLIYRIKAWIGGISLRHVDSHKRSVISDDARLRDICEILSVKCNSSYESLANLDINVRHEMINALRVPRVSGVKGSRLKFFTETVTEDARVRKFKEPWTIDWLRDLPKGAVLYDVGANIGITALTATEDTSKCIKVVAIEPAPANYYSLVRNIQLNEMANRVIALPIGLGSFSDVSTLNLTTYDPGGALHSFGKVVKLPNKEGRQDKVVGSHIAFRYRLDDLVKKNGMPFPSHIKIDVDGAELEVLSGASSILSDDRCLGVQVEAVYNHNSFARLNSIIKIMNANHFIKIAEYPHNNNFPRVTDLQFLRK